jgi:MFS family permease
LDTKLNLRIFFTLFLAVFATTLGVGLVAPLLPVYAHGLGAGAFQIGLIFGAFSLTRTLFVPLFGRLSDLRGRKPLLVSGLLLYAFLSVCYVFSKSVTTLVMIRLGQGFASAMILPVAQAYVGVITPPGREGFTMGLFNMALFGGLSAGPLLGGAVKDLFGIQTSFLSMAALCLVGFLLCLSLLPPEATARAGSRDRPRQSRYRHFLADRAVFALFAFRLGFTTCIGLVWAFLPLLAGTRHGLSSTETGVVVMINVLVSGLLQTPMGYVADRVGKRGLIAAGGLLASAAMVSLHHASSFGHLFLANALLGVSGGLSFPAVMALGVIQGRRGGRMGSIMGVLAMAHSMGMLAGPLIGGLVLDLFSFGVLFGFGAAVVGGGTLLFLVLAAEPRREA